jgi:hypothetical protein
MGFGSRVCAERPLGREFRMTEGFKRLPGVRPWGSISRVGDDHVLDNSRILVMEDQGKSGAKPVLCRNGKWF